MTAQTITYQDGEHTLVGQLFETTGAHAGIVLYPAFEGLSQFALNYAERLANAGYSVFAADMYGDGKTADTIPGCFDLVTPFLEDRGLVRRRAVLALDTFKQHSRVSQFGSIGFCFGGMCGLELARSGAEVAATVAMHGGLPKSDLPTKTIQGHVLILHGYQDPQVPPSTLTGFAEEMAAAGRNDWVFTFFGDGKHSFTDPATGSFDPAKEAEMGREYNERIAEHAYSYAVDFYQRYLG